MLRYNKSTGFDLKFGKLFEIMKKQMNFTYKAIPSKDGGYGSLVSNLITELIPDLLALAITCSDEIKYISCMQGRPSFFKGEGRE